MNYKYESIAEQVRKDICEKGLKAGEKLPSIRNVCEIFNCSISCAIKAYYLLVNNNIIYSVPGSGYFVMENKEHQRENQGEEIFDFASGNMDIQVLPIAEFRDCIDKAIELYKEELFLYSNPMGAKTLREKLSKFFMDYQVFAKPENIAVTSGSQQALDILTRMPFPNQKEKILLEQPTYFCIMNMASLNGIKALGIERTEKGLDLQGLESLFMTEPIKFFYTVSRFQHPTGYSYTSAQKKSLLKLAEKYEVYIIEDDHLADLELVKRNDPIKAFDINNRVIYLRSFSKTLFPGMRLGAIVLPPELVNNFKIYKFNSDVYSSMLSQGALEVYIQSGMHHHHTKRIREHYNKRMRLFKTKWDALKINCRSAYIPETGFYAWIELHDDISAGQLKYNLAKRNVHIDDGSKYYMEQYKKSNFIKLCLSNIKDDKIHRGLVIIKEEIERMKNGR
ncbi:MAG: PLP-dependent aminotransferase family protein [Bacillota bacterium]